MDGLKTYLRWFKNLKSRLHPRPIRIAGSGTQVLVFVKYSGDSNVQPRLRTTVLNSFVWWHQHESELTWNWLSQVFEKQDIKSLVGCLEHVHVSRIFQGSWRFPDAPSPTLKVGDLLSILLGKRLWPPSWGDKLCGNKARGSTYRMREPTLGLVSLSRDCDNVFSKWVRKAVQLLGLWRRRGLSTVFSFSSLFPYLNTLEVTWRAFCEKGEERKPWDLEDI